MCADREGEVRHARLSLSLQVDDLVLLQEWLDGFARACRLPERTAFELDLVLTEAVTNVMTHSRPHGAGGSIEVCCTLEDAVVAVLLTDDCAPFDPTAYQPAALPASLDEAQPGGQGIRLIRRFTANLRYRRENDRNVLSFSVPAEPVPPAGDAQGRMP
jgi:anti-sigma regulatory factor (Ser/Thr protein kinase)